MTSLEELAVRVAAASGADRELDALIASAAWPYRGRGEVIRPAPSGGGRCVSYYRTGNHGTWKSPRYTGTLDAALSLVPEGPNGSNVYPRIARVTPDKWEAHLGFGNRAVGHTARAATAALALCAAALRARSALDTGGE